MIQLFQLVQNNKIPEINQAVLNEAFQIVGNPQDVRKAYVQTVLTQLMLHLIEDPDRVRNVEFKQQANELANLVGRVNVLQGNYKRLEGTNAQLEANVAAQAKLIEGLTKQLAEDRARLRLSHNRLVRAKIADLEPFLTCNQVGAIAIIPLLIPKYWDDLDNIKKSISSWKKVEVLIRDKKYMLEEAKKEVFGVKAWVCQSEGVPNGQGIFEV